MVSVLAIPSQCAVVFYALLINYKISNYSYK